MELVERIVRLAISRARLQQAISTASTCGDHVYVKDNRARLDLLNRKLDALVHTSPKHIIDEARERTNAPI